MEQTISPAVPTAATFSLRPLMFETCTCTMGIVVGPIVGTLVYSLSVGAPYLMVAVLLLAVGLATTGVKHT